jgi:SAM-dependent methyltransferase
MAWFEEVFNEDYDRIYMHTFTDKRNRAEAEFIESALNLPLKSEILDLACGHGRHALILAQKGYKITGIDLSQRFIKIAQDEAKRRQLGCKFEAGDMRKLAYRSRFDGAYCYFTSFGYFSHLENVKVLETVARTLRKGGRFLLDTVNREWVLQEIEAQPRRWEELGPDFVYLEDVSFNARTSRIHARRIVLEGATRREISSDLRLYSLSELEELIERIGMKVLSAFGGKDRSPFSVSSHRMIIVSEKG